MKELKINIPYTLCQFVIILQLMWMQKKVLFPSISGIGYYFIYYMKYIGAFLLLMYKLKRKKDKDLKTNKYICIFIPIFFLYIFIELIAMMQSPIQEQYGRELWSRGIMYILDKICIFIEIVCIFDFTKERAIDCISGALVIDGVILILITILKAGIVQTIQTLLIVFGLANENKASHLLEVHELTYCLALCIIYYLYFGNKNKKHINRLILMCIIFILGGKRIGFAGIIVSGLFALFVHKKGLSKFNIKVVGVIGTFLCVAYVFLLYDGTILTYMNSHGINVMGRDAIYEYFLRRTGFSFKNLGWGLGSVSKLLENMSKSEVGNMASARGLHNDVLKMYIECGFIGSLIWLTYNWLYVPINIFKKVGKKQATLYIALTIFAFITYLTDNTENYFAFQVILLLLPIAAYENKLKDSWENK